MIWNCCHCFVVKVYPTNVTQAHWHHTMECRCSSFRTGQITVDKVVAVRVLKSVKFNYMYFMTSLRGKNEVQVKFEKNIHNCNATLVNWHHTLGCHCSCFGTYAVHKVVPIRVLIAEKLNYFMTSLRGKIRSKLNLKTACTTTMPIEFICIIYWGVSAVVLVLMLFTKWYPSEYWSLKIF